MVRGNEGREEATQGVIVLGPHGIAPDIAVRVVGAAAQAPDKASLVLVRLGIIVLPVKELGSQVLRMRDLQGL